MRSLSAAALFAVAALASGCTIHVVEQPASAQAWSDPQPVVVAPAPRHRARPAPTPAAPPVPQGHAPQGHLATVGRPEPRPTKAIRSRPVVSRPAPSRPATEPVALDSKGRYLFRLTRPEPRGSKATQTTVGRVRERQPIAVAR